MRKVNDKKSLFKKAKKGKILSTLLPLAACSANHGEEGAKPTWSTPFVETEPNTFVAADNFDRTLDQSSSTEDLTVIGKAGDDTITTGSGDDKIMGGEGADAIDAGDGDDIIVLIGVTAAGEYEESDITNPAGSGIDLSDFIDLDYLNDRDISQVEPGETIDGGAGTNTLFIYGDVDLTGVNLENVTIVYINSELTLTADQIAGFTTIDGDESSVINIVVPDDENNYVLDLTSMDISDIAEINIDGALTIRISNLDDLSGIADINGLEGSSITLDIIDNDESVTYDLADIVALDADIDVINLDDLVTLNVEDAADVTISAITGTGLVIHNGDSAVHSALEGITIGDDVRVPPLAVDDASSGHENETLDIDVLANDLDINGDELTITNVSVVGGLGSATVVDNKVRFIPGTDFDYLGPDDEVDVIINYNVYDGLNLDNGSVTITLTGTNDPLTGEPGITGDLYIGATLTATNGTMADKEGIGALSYQWKANGVNIDGATNSTYVLTADELGKTITVQVNFDDDGSSAESAESDETAAISYASFTEVETNSFRPLTPYPSLLDEASNNNNLEVNDSSADNIINTGNGDDTIYSAGGADTINTGAGDDLIYYNGSETIDAGDDDDYIQFGRAGMSVTLGSSNLSNIETIALVSNNVLTIEDGDITAVTDADNRLYIERPINVDATVISSLDFDFQSINPFTSPNYERYTNSDGEELYIQYGTIALSSADVDGSYTHGELIGYANTSGNTYDRIVDFGSALYLPDSTDDLTINTGSNYDDVTTGSGNDTITFSNTFDRIDGGDGDDTLVLTFYNYQPIIHQVDFTGVTSYSNIETIDNTYEDMQIIIDADFIESATDDDNILSITSSRGEPTYVTANETWTLVDTNYNDGYLFSTTATSGETVYLHLPNSTFFTKFQSNLTGFNTVESNADGAVYYNPRPYFLDPITFTSRSNYNDTVILGNVNGTIHDYGGIDYFDGGSGFNSLYYYSAADVIMGTGTATDGTTPADTVLNFNSVYGSSEDDKIFGEDGGQGIYGNEGNDYLRGSGFGVDDGDEDYIVGGAGDDIIAYGYNEEIDGGDDFDTLLYDVAGDQDYNLDHITDDVKNIEKIEFGTNGNDTMIVLKSDIDQVTDADNILYIDGNNTTTLYINEDWLPNGTVQQDSEEYSQYLFNGTTLNIRQANLLFSPDVDGDYAGTEIHGFEETSTDTYRTINEAGSALYIPLETERVTVYGNRGDDDVYSGSGNDYLDLGSGDDYADGGADDDIIFGGYGDDTLFGGDGDDFIVGGDGHDTLNGGDGNDRLVAGGTNETNILNGDDGDDTLSGSGGADTMDGGAGIDTVDLSAGAYAVTINLATNTHSGVGYTEDSIINIENIIGSRHNDNLTGDAGDNTIAGDDGADVMDGGAGSDTLDYSLSDEAVTINLLLAAASGGDADGDVFVNFENVIGSQYDDTITGDDNDNTIAGNSGADVMDGGAGSDTLDYSASDAGVTIDFDRNTVTGGHATGDTIVGFENFIGSDHDDTIIVGHGANVIDGGAGSDTLNYLWSGTAGVTVNLLDNTVSGGYAEGDVISNIENVIGSSHADVITGDNEANILDGAGGRDLLFGLGGDDIFLFNPAHISIGNKDTDSNGDAVTSFAGYPAYYMGGSGEDTLLVTGPGTYFETKYLKYSEIEIIELEGENSSVAIRFDDIVDMTDDDNLLVVKGTSDNTVYFEGFTDTGSTQDYDGVTYDLYTYGASSLLIDQDVTISDIDW